MYGYLDELELGDTEVIAMQSAEDGRAFVNRIVWMLFEKNKNRKIGGFIGWIVGIRKIGDLEKYFVILFGANPYAA